MSIPVRTVTDFEVIRNARGELAVVLDALDRAAQTVVIQEGRVVFSDAAGKAFAQLVLPAQYAGPAVRLVAEMAPSGDIMREHRLEAHS